MWPNLQFPADWVTFTEEILHEKLHFLSSVYCMANLKVSEILCLRYYFFFLLTSVIYWQFNSKEPRMIKSIFQNISCNVIISEIYQYFKNCWFWIENADDGKTRVTFYMIYIYCGTSSAEVLIAIEILYKS